MANPWYDSDSEDGIVFGLDPLNTSTPPFYDMDAGRIYENVSLSHNLTEDAELGQLWQPSYPLLLGIGIYMTFIGIASTVGNVLFIITATRWRFMRNNAHMLLLLNMSVCDLAISITGYPYTTVAGYLGEWPFGDLMCTLYGFLCFTFSQVSMNTLVAVSAFRYIAVCRPHNKHLLRPEYSWLAISICWIHALFWTGFPLLGWSSYTFEPTGISCSLNWHDHSLSGVTYTMGCILFCYVTHIMALLWFYRKIFGKVTHLGVSKNWRKMRQQQTELESPPATFACESVVVFSFITENLSPLEMHVLRMNVLMVVAYIVCWTPYAVVSGLSHMNADLSPFWYVFPTLFAKTSCILNPLVYGLTNAFLRKELLSVVRNCCGLASPMEEFQLMRQRQQEGLYNKEGIYTGRRVKSSCTCSRCAGTRKASAITQREMIDRFVRQLKEKSEQEEAQLRQLEEVATATSNLISPSSESGSLSPPIPNSKFKSKSKNSKSKKSSLKPSTNTIFRSASVNLPLSLGFSNKNTNNPSPSNSENVQLIVNDEYTNLQQQPSLSMPKNLAPNLPITKFTVEASLNYEYSPNTKKNIILTRQCSEPCSWTGPGMGTTGPATGTRGLPSSLLLLSSPEINIKTIEDISTDLRPICSQSNSDNTQFNKPIIPPQIYYKDTQHQHPNNFRNHNYVNTATRNTNELVDLDVFNVDTSCSESTISMESPFPSTETIVSHSITITSV